MTHIAAAKSEQTNTPPAAKSFINPAFSFCSLKMTSTVFSMAVLKISAANTTPIARAIKHHSVEFNSVNTPITITPVAAARCTGALRSFLKNHLIPVSAKPTLLINFEIKFSHLQRRFFYSVLHFLSNQMLQRKQ